MEINRPLSPMEQLQQEVSSLRAEVAFLRTVVGQEALDKLENQKDIKSIVDNLREKDLLSGPLSFAEFRSYNSWNSVKKETVSFNDEQKANYYLCTYLISDEAGNISLFTGTNNADYQNDLTASAVLTKSGVYHLLFIPTPVRVAGSRHFAGKVTLPKEVLFEDIQTVHVSNKRLKSLWEITETKGRSEAIINSIQGADGPTLRWWKYFFEKEMIGLYPEDLQKKVRLAVKNNPHLQSILPSNSY